MASKVAKDKYRSFIHDEAENIQWRHGGPPVYDVVNQLFEEGRTKVHQTLFLYPFYIVPSHFHWISYICRNGQKDHWRRQCKMLLSHGRWSSHTRSACRTSRPLTLKSSGSLLMVSTCVKYVSSPSFSMSKLEIW